MAQPRLLSSFGALAPSSDEFFARFRQLERLLEAASPGSRILRRGCTCLLDSFLAVHMCS